MCTYYVCVCVLKGILLVDIYAYIHTIMYENALHFMTLLYNAL